MAATDDDFVILKGGLVASVAALRVLWSLEDRGLQVRVVDGATLQVLPVAAQTAADAAAIRQHKAELIQLVQYDADAVVA